MKNKEEFEQGDRRIAKNWAIVFFSYVLLLLWLEPLIDVLLGLNPPDPDQSAINTFNDQKAHIAAIAFGIARSLPILLFLWLAYQVVLTSRLPPKTMKMPLTIKVIKGEHAKSIGIAMIVLSLLLLFREVHLIVNA